MLYRIRQAVEDVAFNVCCKIRPWADVGVVRLPLDPRLSIVVRRSFSNDQYEVNERRIVELTLEANDRVLECGTGIGLLSTLAAKRVGSDRVKTFEANPYMADIINRTYALNDVAPTLVIGAIGPQNGQLQFHVRKNFYASSPHAQRAEGSRETLSVPMHALHAEIVATSPTYLFIDIEGGEERLVGCSDLPGVLKVMTEVHPELIGAAGVQRFIQWLQELGFVKSDQLSTQMELFFER